MARLLIRIIAALVTVGCGANSAFNRLSPKKEEANQAPEEIPPASSMTSHEGHFLTPPGVSGALSERIKAAVFSFNSATAFFVSQDGLAISNYHVVRNCLAKNYDRIVASDRVTKYDPELVCEGFKIVALPPDPQMKTREVGFYSDGLSVNRFLDWKAQRTEKSRVIDTLKGELEVDDWALIRIATISGRPINLTKSPMSKGMNLVSYGAGSVLDRLRDKDNATLTFLKNYCSEQLPSLDRVTKMSFEKYMARIDKGFEYRRFQSTLPVEKRTIPDWDAGWFVPKMKWALGNTRDDGFFAREWLNDFSIEYLKIAVSPQLILCDDNEDRCPVWQSAESAREGNVKLLESFKSDIENLSATKRTPKIESLLSWRIRNLEARANSDLNHEFYAEELKLLHSCQCSATSDLCQSGTAAILKILVDNIRVWKMELPEAELNALITKAETAINSAEQELLNESFNGLGFVSDSDVVSGHSGSPLVNVDSGEVVGIHRAGPYGDTKVYIPGRFHVDANRIRTQLEEIGIKLD